MNGFQTLTFEKDSSIALVTLNRPEALNTYNIQMRDDLFEVFGAIRNDDEIRVVVLKGSGEKAFCSGADLSEFLSAPPPVAARRVRFERDVWTLFLENPQPVIAALHGYVLGSGIEMAMCCDIRLASEDACFGLPEVNLGIIPAAGGTQTLSRTVGQSNALDVLLTGRWIDAGEALHMKLINQITEKDRLYGTALEMARRIASFDPLAVRFAKQAIRRGADLPLAEGLLLESRLTARLNNDKRHSYP